VYCPFCRHPDSRVIDSRVAEDGTAIRRRRSCPECGRRFTTQESVILMVAKRSGVTEPFTRDKIVRGVQRACQGRPVDEDQLAMLAQRVEEILVVARAESSSGREVLGSRERAHVPAGLGDDHLGGAALHAGDRAQQFNLLGERCHVPGPGWALRERRVGSSA
jgi:transcriptional regulator NrdR